jgi:hypothetical protein
MDQTNINNSIANAFLQLSNCNEMIYDYWVSMLYKVDGDFNENAWNEDNLSKMEDDVMYNS